MRIAPLHVSVQRAHTDSHRIMAGDVYLFAADVEHVHKPLLKPAPVRALPAPRARGSRAVRFARVHAGAVEIESGKIAIFLFSMSFIHVAKLLALNFFRRRHFNGQK